LSRLKIIWAWLLLIFLSNCMPSHVLRSPFPGQIERIEGYASLKVTSSRESARSKFSFLFQLPGQGRIEVSDFLGRMICQVIIDNGNAFFIVPSERIFWRGKEEEIIDKFLGVRLDLFEIVCLLTGRWQGSLNGWVFDKDALGRVKQGRRKDLTFEVKEFINHTSLTRLLVYKQPFNEGRLKIINIAFNNPIKKNVFSVGFLESFEQKSWAEIVEMIDNED